MNYFSSSYNEGREKFLNLCKSRKIHTQSHINPNAKTADGNELAMDTAWFGPKDADKVILMMSGAHGLEAATGAAIFLDWIDNDEYSQLPGDVAVMLVHAINPYGWAYSSRTNEDNIDINRNYLNHQKPHPKNSTYPDMHNLLTSNDMSCSGLEQSRQNFHDFAKTHGGNSAIQGVCGGQYDHPKGVGYGGKELCWSNRMLSKIVQENLYLAKKVVVIDWHTGIGSFGEPFLIMDDRKGSELFSRAGRWWGENNIHTEDVFEETGNLNYTGLLIQGIKNDIKKLNEADVLSTVIEWGTYGMDTMLQALLMDRWLRVDNENPQSIEATMVKTRLIERFYPSMPEWRRAVLTGSQMIYKQTLEGIMRWQ